jgi:hypothetical protein
VLGAVAVGAGGLVLALLTIGYTLWIRRFFCQQASSCS